MIYFHIETEDLYKIISDDAEWKDPITRKWVPAIIYTRADIISKHYVREKADFFAHFKPKN